MLSGNAILFSEMTPDASWEGAFNSWYDQEHIPLRMACEGFRSAQRFHNDAPDSRSYLAVYELDSLAALATPAYQVVKQHPSQTTASMLGGVTGFTRYLCERIDDQGADTETDAGLDSAFIYAVWFKAPEPDLPEFDAGTAKTMCRCCCAARTGCGCGAFAWPMASRANGIASRSTTSPVPARWSRRSAPRPTSRRGATSWPCCHGSRASTRSFRGSGRARSALGKNKNFSDKNVNERDTSDDLRIIPSSVQSQVLQKLRTAILNGTFQPGERLIEGDLCTRIGVSRASIREAAQEVYGAIESSV